MDTSGSSPSSKSGGGSSHSRRSSTTASSTSAHSAPSSPSSYGEGIRSGRQTEVTAQEVHTHTHTYVTSTLPLGTSPPRVSISPNRSSRSLMALGGGSANVSRVPNAHDGSSYSMRSSVNTSSASQQRSVRDALAELNLKTRLLEDERDYYASLNMATQKAYDHHRRELQSLLVKERDTFSSSQRTLEAQLEALLQNNREAHQYKLDDRERIMRDMRRLQEEAKKDSATRIAQMRGEMDEHVATLRIMKDQTNALMGQKEGLEDDIRQLLRRQEMLRAELLRRKAEQRALLDDEGKAPKPFIPGGRTQRDDYAPSSHNLNALVSTIHNRSYMLPGEHKRFKSPAARPQPPLVDDASSAILRELMDLRLEYHMLAEQLNNPHTDVTTTSIRLREILEIVERKKEQLRKVRSSQKVRHDDEKLHGMLRSIAQQNNMAERLYSDLIACLRTPY